MSFTSLKLSSSVYARVSLPSCTGLQALHFPHPCDQEIETYLVNR